MTRVVSLVTFADLRESPDAHAFSVSARHEAVLENGRRVLLLDGRGWTASLRGPGAAETDDPWAFETEEGIAESARMVVGPDEAYGDRSQSDMEAGHWTALAASLQAQGVEVDPNQLRDLPHEVVLSDRLRARLS